MAISEKHSLKAIIILCAIAFINAAYLVSRRYLMTFTGEQGNSFCDINSSISCSNVLGHPASQIAGIPFPVIALVVYPVLAAIARLALQRSSKKHWIALSILSAMGITFNGYFIYQEITIIHSVCILCLLCSAIIVTICGISLTNAARKNL